MYRLRTIALAIALLTPLTGLAQQNTSAEAMTDEIMVTASRFPDAGLSAPIGARIITARQIADSGASNIAEALNRLGGVHPAGFVRRHQSRARFAWFRRDRRPEYAGAGRRRASE